MSPRHHLDPSTLVSYAAGLSSVRLGPYQSLDDANRIKVTLSQNGVGAAIIRVAEDAKKQ